MALKAILTADEFKSVGEALKSEYVQKDDKFFLAVTPVEGYALEDVSGLKTSLAAERTAKTAAEKRAEKFKDLDPNTNYQALITELEELKAIDPKKEADKLVATKLESAKQQLVQKHDSELKAREDRIKHLTGTVEKLLIDSVAKGAIAEAKGSIDLLIPHVRSQTRVKEENGEFSVEVIDANGNGRIGDNKGSPMSISELIAEMKTSDKYGRAFESDNQSGSGKRPGNGGGGTLQPKRSLMTPEQKRDYQVKHGQKAFLELPLK